MARSRKSASTDAVLKELRAFGLSFPGTHTKSPWPGHLDLAVNDKTFAYLSIEGEPFSIGCKLPSSSQMALMLPFVTPMAYGLGKSGWVSARPDPDEELPVEMFKAWLDESYRAQAPKKLVASLTTAPAGKQPAGKQTAANKPAAKNSATKKTAANKPAAKKR